MVLYNTHIRICLSPICLIGCRLYNYGIGIHLIENPSIDDFDTVTEPRPINPKDNHISFQVRLL